MDRIIWMFINKENPQNIINVVGTDCAKQMVSLMTNEDWNNWYVRRQNWPKARLLRTAHELTEGILPRQTNVTKDVLTELPDPETALNASYGEVNQLHEEEEESHHHEELIEEEQEAPSAFASEVNSSEEGYEEQAPVKEKKAKFDENHWIERRKYPRFNFKFRIVIIVEGRIFRTYSKNISLGGNLRQRRSS